MERLVLTELEKQKNELRERLKNNLKSPVSEDETEYIVSSVDRCIMNLVEILKEGKSAHEKFFSDIILNSPDAIIGYDREGKIFLWNKGAENILGYHKEEIQGRDYKTIIPNSLLKKGEAKRLEKEIEQKGYISNFETKRLTKSGDIKNVTISMFNIMNEKNEIIGKVSIVRDITNEKNLERELREKENLALIGTVVSSIAHNLSNPLNIISGNADYLLLDRKDGDEGFEELNIILQETTRITKSIRQILNFSRPVHLTKKSVKLNELLKSVIDNAKFLQHKEQKDIKYLSNFSDEIPDLYIDKDQISDVISNMINNSIQAIRKSGTVSVKSYCKEYEDTGKTKKCRLVVIEITDTGIGIKPEDIDKVFIPFFSTKDYGKGTGLGLAFSERVIKEHKGFIKVNSVPDKSTTFSVYLPVDTP